LRSIEPLGIGIAGAITTYRDVEGVVE